MSINMSVKETKWAAEAQARGFTWLAQVDRQYSKYRHSCGHERNIKMDQVRIGRAGCAKCQKNQTVTVWASEARGQGWEWITQIDYNKSLYRCSVCTCEQQILMGNMRSGEVRCTSCLDRKYQSEADIQGWKFQKKISTLRGLYFHSCGHEQEIDVGAMREGRVVCHGCGESWATKPSSIYLLRITVDEVSFLKLGIAKDVGVRTTTYGLPDRAVVSVVRTIAHPTGQEAVKHEKRIHRTIVDHPAVSRFDASYWMTNGKTECYVYSKEAENALSHAMFVESTRKKAIGF